jgi:hypothetical protein
MSRHFDAKTLELLSRAKLVRIETRKPRGPRRQTIIWVVVDGKDAYVRSYRGKDGRWYREIRAHPQASLLVKGRRIALRAAPVRSAATIARVSRGYFKKYGVLWSSKAMVRREVLGTTLRLAPRQPA